MTGTRRAAYVAMLAVALACSLRAADDDDDDNGGNRQQRESCTGMPSHAQLREALIRATLVETSGLNLHTWGTLVNRDGIVCAVAYTGVNRGAEWPGSRVISVQKAYTANSFSLDRTSFGNGSGRADGLAISTANLYSATQPGGTLFALPHSNPVSPADAYKGPALLFGTLTDPLVGKRMGGVNVFGGGLGLYATGQIIVGGLGVSGDTPCADHHIAWRTRNYLGLDHLRGAGGFSGDPTRPDNIVFDIALNPTGGTGISSGGFGHPTCSNLAPPSILPQTSF